MILTLFRSHDRLKMKINLRSTQPNFKQLHLIITTMKNLMKSIKHILLSFVNLEIFNSRSSIYFLVLMFIILLIATETLIKNTILPI